MIAGPDQAVVALVQQPTPPSDEPGGRGEDFGKSSPVGLVVLLLFFVAVGFLVRSMTRHLRRVPASFDEPDQADREPDQADHEPGQADHEPGREPGRGTDPDQR